MSVLRITGGKPLHGTVEVSGSKNAALAILASVPLVQGRIEIDNVPDIADVRIKLELLRGFGIEAEFDNNHLVLDTSNLRQHEPDEELVRRIRTGFYMLGPLLARLGSCRLPMPGGCKIGSRPVDFHLKGLSALGATINTVGGWYVASAEELVGAEIYLDSPSAGATQHLMAAATLATGCTVIQNASIEPEVVTLAAFLSAMGARIEGAGTSTITVTGVSKLGSGSFRVPADRIQAGTYLLAGAITLGDVTVTGILPENQTALVNKLREAGVSADEGPDYVRVWAESRPRGIRIKTMPYPGFPTDIQQPMSALLALADGVSVIDETIYESRTGHVSELNRMGGRLRIEGHSVIIDGVEGLTGAVVEASDLRAGAALCVAALAAEGESYVKNVHFIDRGYAQLEENITKLGGTIERIDAESAVASATAPWITS